VLEEAYRRALKHQLLSKRIEGVAAAVESEAALAEVPADLRARVEARLAREPALPWDDAVAAEIAT